jgi:mannose-6-phosphate isomerase
MHLFEAALAWMAIDPNPVWRELADEIAELFRNYFYDASESVVRENFTAEWRALDDNGRYRVEPGHHYEWAWLLLRWERMTGGNTENAPRAMIDFAETHGYDAHRHVAFNECWNDGEPHDEAARLWPQTERLKAWLKIAESSVGVSKFHAESKALDAARAIAEYLKVDERGMWRDVMLKDGTFKQGASPASSFYHIMCALGELATYAAHPAPADAVTDKRPDSKLKTETAAEISL